MAEPQLSGNELRICVKSIEPMAVYLCNNGDRKGTNNHFLEIDDMSGTMTKNIYGEKL
jgi:hypothetical protein